MRKVELEGEKEREGGGILEVEEKHRVTDEMSMVSGLWVLELNRSGKMDEKEDRVGNL